jgi:chromosome segregation ATPase
MQANRTKNYTDIFTKISAAQAKLKEQSVDTTQLDAAVTKYTTLVTQLTSDLATYKQNIDDASAMECAKDVTGFKSILETARTGRTTLIKDSADVTAQLGAIKSALSSIKAAQSTEKK